MGKKYIAMYEKAINTKKYKVLFWLITLPLLPTMLITAPLIIVGEYCEKFNLLVMRLRSKIIEEIWVFCGWEGAEVKEYGD